MNKGGNVCKKQEIYLDTFTRATLQSNGDICCPHCGSWTHMDDLNQDSFTGETNCPLCKQEALCPTTKTTTPPTHPLNTSGG